MEWMHRIVKRNPGVKAIVRSPKLCYSAALVSAIAGANAVESFEADYLEYEDASLHDLLRKQGPHLRRLRCDLEWIRTDLIVPPVLSIGVTAPPASAASLAATLSGLGWCLLSVVP